MSKIVMSGYYGFSNAGDEALLTAILAALRKIEPDSDITVISGNPAETRHKHKVHSLYRFAGLSIWRALGQADLLISGGGSLLQDVTSKKSLLYYLTVILAAKLRGKKVMLFAQGIGPIRSGFMRYLTCKVCSRADLITVRDADSAEELVRIGIDRDKVQLTADSVLTLASSDRVPGLTLLEREGFDVKKPVIAVSVRRWADDIETLMELGKSLGALRDRFDAQIVILPLQYPADVEVSKMLDKFIPRGLVEGELMEGIKERHTENRVAVLERSLSTEEFLSIIANTQLLIGMRLHSLIFAAVSGVPFLALSYDPKVDGFVKSLAMEPVGKVGELDGRKILEAAEKIWEKEPTEQNEAVEELKKKAASNAQKAFELIEEK